LWGVLSSAYVHVFMLVMGEVDHVSACFCCLPASDPSPILLRSLPPPHLILFNFHCHPMIIIQFTSQLGPSARGKRRRPSRRSRAFRTMACSIAPPATPSQKWQRMKLAKGAPFLGAALLQERRARDSHLHMRRGSLCIMENILVTLCWH